MRAETTEPGEGVYNPPCKCGHGWVQHIDPLRRLSCLVYGCDCSYWTVADKPGDAEVFEAGPFVADDAPAPRVCAAHHSPDVEGEWVCWEPEGHAGEHSKTFRIVRGPAAPPLTRASNPSPFATRDDLGVWRNLWGEAIPPAGFGHLALLVAGFCPFCFASAESVAPFDGSGAREKLGPAGHYRACLYPLVRHGWQPPPADDGRSA